LDPVGAPIIDGAGGPVVSLKARAAVFNSFIPYLRSGVNKKLPSVGFST
jgi:hypothetical protein